MNTLCNKESAWQFIQLYAQSTKWQKSRRDILLKGRSRNFEVRQCQEKFSFNSVLLCTSYDLGLQRDTEGATKQAAPIAASDQLET
jgi:hypothetical protein